MSKDAAMIFFPQYCFDCQCAFISKTRHARCWACNGTNVINCFREIYDVDL